MSYNINKNTRIYYVWTLRYDKYICKWLDLYYSTTDIRGNGRWVSDSNYKFLTLTFHSRNENDSLEPSIPSDLNYPGYPSSSYCSIQYAKWRVIKSSSYSGEPYSDNIVDSQGDDFWVQITPYEYEMIQSTPIFCANSPQLPSFANSILKNDDDNSYRKFRARWSYNSDGVLTYVSGPTYVTSVKEKGSEKWKYDGNNFYNSNFGIVYEITWVSSVIGIGTAPKSVISDEVISDISTETISELSDDSLPESSVSIYEYTINSSSNLYSGYPIYRTEYDCSEKTYSDVELIAFDNNENQKRSNEWEYVNVYSSLNNKCVFYYYSSSYQENKTIAEANSLNKPPVSEIDLYQCPCSYLIDVESVLSSTNFITVIISGITGRARLSNGIYKVPKTEENIWELEESEKEIVIKYSSSIWSFSFSDYYEGNNHVRINKLIDLDNSFVGNFRIVFNSDAEFKDEDTTGTCSISFEGNTLEQYVVTTVDETTSATEALTESSEESSSSSSSSTDEDQNTIVNNSSLFNEAVAIVQEELTQRLSNSQTSILPNDPTVHIDKLIEDYYGPE